MINKKNCFFYCDEITVAAEPEFNQSKLKITYNLCYGVCWYNICWELLFISYDTSKFSFKALAFA